MKESQTSIAEVEPRRSKATSRKLFLQISKNKGPKTPSVVILARDPEAEIPEDAIEIKSQKHLKNTLSQHRVVFPNYVIANIFRALSSFRRFAGGEAIYFTHYNPVYNLIRTVSNIVVELPQYGGREYEHEYVQYIRNKFSRVDES